MEGADIYQIAKNCRTSVEMIEKYYASHIKNTLDAAAINVRKPKPTKKNDKPAGGRQISLSIHAVLLCCYQSNEESMTLSLKETPIKNY